MKPLLQTQLKTFLERFDYFRDAEFRSIKIISTTNITLTFALQDSARAFDWITITLYFYGVSDARLIDDKQVNFIDLSDGVTLLFNENMFAFAAGECYNISTLKNSSLYLVAEDIKYEEGQF